MAAKVVIAAIHSDVFDALAVFHKNLAIQVTPIRHHLVTNPREFAVIKYNHACSIWFDEFHSIIFLKLLNILLIYLFQEPSERDARNF